MTAKRFIVKNIMFDGDCIVDTTDDGYYTTDKQDLDNLCELLNELHEENERLYDEIFRLRTELAYDRTEKEEHSDSVYDFIKKLEKW